MKSSRHEIKAYKNCKDLQWHWVRLHTTAVVMVLQQLLVEGQETQAALLGKPHYHLCLLISIASLHTKLRRYLSQVCSSSNKLGSFLLLIPQDQEEHVGGRGSRALPQPMDTAGCSGQWFWHRKTHRRRPDLAIQRNPRWQGREPRCPRPINTSVVPCSQNRSGTSGLDISQVTKTRCSVAWEENTTLLRARQGLTQTIGAKLRF